MRQMTHRTQSRGGVLWAGAPQLQQRWCGGKQQMELLQCWCGGEQQMERRSGVRTVRTAEGHHAPNPMPAADRMQLQRLAALASVLLLLLLLLLLRVWLLLLPVMLPVVVVLLLLLRCAWSPPPPVH